MRGGAVRGVRAPPRRALLPLHSLPAAHGHGLLGERADGPGSFTITRGEELVRSWQPADGWGKSFCGECGSHLFSTGLENPELVAVRIGTLDEDPGTRPSFHQFVDYAAAWDVLPDDGLPRHGERVPADVRQGE